MAVEGSKATGIGAVKYDRWVSGLVIFVRLISITPWSMEGSAWTTDSGSSTKAVNIKILLLAIIYFYLILKF